MSSSINNTRVTKNSLTVSQSKICTSAEKVYMVKKRKKKRNSLSCLCLNSPTFGCNLWCSRVRCSAGSCSLYSCFLFNWLGCFRNFFFLDFFLFLLDYFIFGVSIFEFAFHQFTVFFSGKDKVSLFIGERDCLVFILSNNSK